MSIKVISTGMRKLIADMSGYVEELNDGIAEVLTNEASEVEREAKKNHRYISRSGNLERATKGTYKYLSLGVHSVVFELQDNLTNTGKDNGKGDSYGPWIHEGTYQEYSKSPIAPLYSHSISKSGKGWRADPFLWNAIEKKWNPEKGIQKMSAKLKRKYERV